MSIDDASHPGSRRFPFFYDTIFFTALFSDEGNRIEHVLLVSFAWFMFFLSRGIKFES